MDEREARAGEAVSHLRESDEATAEHAADVLTVLGYPAVLPIMRAALVAQGAERSGQLDAAPEHLDRLISVLFQNLHCQVDRDVLDDFSFRDAKDVRRTLGQLQEIQDIAAVLGLADCPLEIVWTRFAKALSKTESLRFRPPPRFAGQAESVLYSIASESERRRLIGELVDRLDGSRRD
jgi:hypothetical protein